MSLARLVLSVLAVCLTTLGTSAEQSYSRGQNASPAYEGWEEDADGTRYFLFGYLNRNWEEELDVPVGIENFFSPGEPDRGQPTHFLPRRNRFVFRVPVPDGFGETDELIWTLTTKGKTERAYATQGRLFRRRSSQGLRTGGAGRRLERSGRSGEQGPGASGRRR